MTLISNFPTRRATRAAVRLASVVALFAAASACGKSDGMPRSGPEPSCGDETVDPGEECDPTGSLCTTGVACLDDCTCESEPVGCCECTRDGNRNCFTNVTANECVPTQECVFVVTPGAQCNLEGRCATNCCMCPGVACMTVASPDLCPTDCAVVPANSMCDSAGKCQLSPNPGGG